MEPDGIVKECAEGSDGCVIGHVGRIIPEIKIPPLSNVQTAILYDKVVPWTQLSYSFKKGLVRMVLQSQNQKIMNHPEIGRAREMRVLQQGFNLGPKGEAILVNLIIERFHAQPI